MVGHEGCRRTRNWNLSDTAVTEVHHNLATLTDAPPGEAERASDFATLNGGETRLETFSGILGNADSSSLPNAEIDPAYWQNLIDKILG